MVTPKTWVTIWSRWAKSIGYKPDITSYDAKQVDKKLDNFFGKYERRLIPTESHVICLKYQRPLTVFFKEAGSVSPLPSTEKLFKAAKYSKGSPLPPWAGLRQTSWCVQCIDQQRWRTVVGERTPWQPVTEVSNRDKMVFWPLPSSLYYEAVRNGTTCLSKHFLSVKMSMVLKTSRTNKIVQKLAGADFFTCPWFNSPVA